MHHLLGRVRSEVNDAVEVGYQAARATRPTTPATIATPAPINTMPKTIFLRAYWDLTMVS
jgi:hypothetical protein